MSTINTELPVDQKAVKKMEKDIAKETKADEKDYQRALKQLKRTEISEAKASKAASKADRNLRKMEEKEDKTIKSLQKATHKHDQAITNLHTAQNDVQIQKQQAQRLKHNVDTLRVRVDEQLRVKQAHEEERNRRLANLHSSPPPTTV